MKFHDIAALFPMFGAEELQALADDIKANGLREPVVLFEGAILDGRNRYTACEMAGVPLRYVTYEGTDPVGYVLSLNLHRRHLTTSQRAMVAVEVRRLFEAEARAHVGGRPSGKPPTEMEEVFASPSQTAVRAAEALSVSPSLVYEAARVKKEAPQLAEQVSRGDLTVGRASRMMTADGTEPAPYELDTPRKHVVAESNKQRLIEGLSTMNGICRGLEDLNMQAIRAALGEDMATWANMAADLSKRLRYLKQRLS